MSSVFDEVCGTKGVLAHWTLMTEAYGQGGHNGNHNTSPAPSLNIPPIHPLLYALEAKAVATGGNAAPTDPAHAYGTLKVVVDCADLRNKHGAPLLESEINKSKPTYLQGS